MYKNLIVSGCSFFDYPWEWENTERPSYDKEIGKLKGKENYKKLKKYGVGNILHNFLGTDKLYNFAQPGKSNESIIYDVKNKLVEKNIDNSIVLIGLTQSARYNIPAKKDIYSTYKFYIEPQLSKYESLTNKHQCTFEDLKKFNELRHKVYFSLEHYNNELILELDFINKFLKSINSKLIVINNLYDVKISDKEYLFEFSTNTNKWGEFIKSYDNTYQLVQHPNADDHRILAEELFKFLK